MALCRHLIPEIDKATNWINSAACGEDTRHDNRLYNFSKLWQHKKIDYRNEVTCTTGQEQSTTSSHRHPEVMRKLIFLLTGPIQKLKNIWKDSRTVKGKN